MIDICSGIEQEGDYFEVFFYDLNSFDKGVPMSLNIHIEHLREYYEAKTCDEHNRGYYEDDAPRKTKFEDLINDVLCRGERDRYLKELTLQMISNREEVRTLRKNLQTLRQEYDDLLHMYKVLNGTSIIEAPVLPLKQAVFSMAKAEVERVRTEEDEHAREVYQQNILKPYKKAANS